MLSRKLLRHLNGLIVGGRLIRSSRSPIIKSTGGSAKKLNEVLPPGDRERKKFNWISARFRS